LEQASAAWRCSPHSSLELRRALLQSHQRYTS
jgi:hypothetical protein